jgi:hypothetical protein
VVGFKKDFIVNFKLATIVGGIYMPVDQGITPNPYLAHLPNWDVTTNDGRTMDTRHVRSIYRKSTPAYPVRQDALLFLRFLSLLFCLLVSF